MNSVKTRQGLANEPVEDRARGGGVVNRRIVLKRNPEGEPKPSDFEVVTEEVPPVAEGQMLLRTKWLTLNPYMRGLDASGPMNNERSLAARGANRFSDFRPSGPVAEATGALTGTFESGRSESSQTGPSDASTATK